VLVFDGKTGLQRTNTPYESYVGWAEDRGLMKWHPDRARLATNLSTNGIGVLRGGRWVGSASPDETRDHGVRYAWVGDRLFADTGAFFEIHDGDRLGYEELNVTNEPGFLDVWRNAHVGAIIGTNGTQLIGFDPHTKKELIARELLEAGLSRQQKAERLHKLARDYAAGREDALELLADFEPLASEALTHAGE